MKQTRKYAIAVGVCAIFALGAWLGTAMADRSVTAPPIVYSGQVLNASGTPIADSATNSVSLSLYDGDDSGADTRLCPVVSSTTVATRAGHFSLPLSTACSNVFERAEEVWVHLTVNGTVIAPTRAAAVPYAVHAERASVLGVPRRMMSSVASYPGRVVDAALAPGLVGLPAVRAICQATMGGSPTAHLCYGSEIARARYEGATFPTPVPPIGWHLAPEYQNILETFDTGVSNSVLVGDCGGFASSATSCGTGLNCVSWREGYGSYAGCDQMSPLLCCD